MKALGPYFTPQNKYSRIEILAPNRILPPEIHRKLRWWIAFNHSSQGSQDEYSLILGFTVLRHVKGGCWPGNRSLPELSSTIPYQLGRECPGPALDGGRALTWPYALPGGRSCEAPLGSTAGRLRSYPLAPCHHMLSGSSDPSSTGSYSGLLLSRLCRSPALYRLEILILWQIHSSEYTSSCLLHSHSTPVIPSSSSPMTTGRRSRVLPHSLHVYSVKKLVRSCVHSSSFCSFQVLAALVMERFSSLSV